MPNGRSGGFTIAKSRLEELVRSLDSHTPIGRRLPRLSAPATLAPSGHDVDTAAVLIMISEFPGTRIWVEEQDHTFYILHLDHEVEQNLEPEVEKWVMVHPESALFDLLTRRR